MCDGWVREFSLLLCTRVMGFWLEICTSVMHFCGVRNLVRRVQCDKGLVCF